MHIKENVLNTLSIRAEDVLLKVHPLLIFRDLMSGLEKLAGQRSRRSGKRSSSQNMQNQGFMTQPIQVQSDGSAFVQPVVYQPPQIQQQNSQSQPQINQIPQYIGYPSQPLYQPQISQDQSLIQKIAQIEAENKQLADQCAKQRKRIQDLEQKMFEFYTKFNDLNTMHPVKNEIQKEPTQRQQPQPKKHTQKIH